MPYARVAPEDARCDRFRAVTIAIGFVLGAFHKFCLLGGVFSAAICYSRHNDASEGGCAFNLGSPMKEFQIDDSKDRTRDSGTADECYSAEKKSSSDVSCYKLIL